MFYIFTPLRNLLLYLFLWGDCRCGETRLASAFCRAGEGLAGFHYQSGLSDWLYEVVFPTSARIKYSGNLNTFIKARPDFFLLLLCLLNLVVGTAKVCIFVF